MTQLPALQFSQLQAALVDSFTPVELRLMVRTQLGEDLTAIHYGENLSDTAFELVRWAERHERTDELIAAALAERPTNEALKALAAGHPTTGIVEARPSKSGGRIMGDEQKVDTGGGAYIGGNVSADGDFVGRDKVVHGNEVQGDKYGGVTFGNVQGGVKGNVIAGGDITGLVNIGSVESREDVLTVLEQLLTEIEKAAQVDALDEEIAVDAESNVKKAVIQAKKADPNKKQIMEYLSQAKEVIVTATGGAAAIVSLVTALTKATELVQKYF